MAGRSISSRIASAIEKLAFERPNSRFIYLRGPATGQIQYDAGGYCKVPLDPAKGDYVDLTRFRQVSVCISSRESTARRLVMGTLSGNTLGEPYDLPLDSKIHTFNVVGPEMYLSMNGPKNTQEEIQLWVYLRS